MNAQAFYIEVIGEEGLVDVSFGKPVLVAEGFPEVVIAREDFKGPDGRTLEWSKIATFEITIVDTETRDKLDLTSKEGLTVLLSIKLAD